MWMFMGEVVCGCGRMVRPRRQGGGVNMLVCERRSKKVFGLHWIGLDGKGPILS